MALWDEICTIIEGYQPSEEPATITDEIMKVIEEHEEYEAAQAAADRRWNEGRY